MAKPKKRSTPGMADIENVIEVIEQEEKAARKKQWLEEHYGKKNAAKGGDANADINRNKNSKG